MDSVSPDCGKVCHLIGENGCSIHDACNDLQSGDITVIGYVLTLLPPGRAGGQSCLQLFWLIVTWWQWWQEGWAGLASDTEHQPSLLAHIQPSALISRYVLTIALMWLLSGEALLPPSLPCLCNAPAASRLSLSHYWGNSGAEISRCIVTAQEWLTDWRHTGYRILPHMSWVMWINISLNQLLGIKHIGISDSRTKCVKQDDGDGRGR